MLKHGGAVGAHEVVDLECIDFVFRETMHQVCLGHFLGVDRARSWSWHVLMVGAYVQKGNRTVGLSKICKRHGTYWPEPLGRPPKWYRLLLSPSIDHLTVSEVEVVENRVVVEIKDIFTLLS